MGACEKGFYKVDDEVYFIPKTSKEYKLEGKIERIEKNHVSVDQVDNTNSSNCGIVIKGLNIKNLPKRGSVMLKKNDFSLSVSHKFSAKIFIFDDLEKIKPGNIVTIFNKKINLSLEILEIVWKKKNGEKLFKPTEFEINDQALIIFQTEIPIVVDFYKNSHLLSNFLFYFDPKKISFVGRIFECEMENFLWNFKSHFTFPSWVRDNITKIVQTLHLFQKGFKFKLPKPILQIILSLVLQKRIN